mgnify:CR=1 FL=1
MTNEVIHAREDLERARNTDPAVERPPRSMTKFEPNLDDYATLLALALCEREAPWRWRRRHLRLPSRSTCELRRVPKTLKPSTTPSSSCGMATSSCRPTAAPSNRRTSFRLPSPNSARSDVDVSVEPFTSSFASATEGVQLVDSMGGLDEDGSPGDLCASLTAGAHHARFAHRALGAIFRSRARSLSVHACSRSARCAPRAAWAERTRVEPEGLRELRL